MSHTCRPGHPGVLADGCARCRQHAEEPMLLSLDPAKMGALWDAMVEAERGGGGGYATESDAIACRNLYRLAVWLQRYASVRDPFRPLAEVFP